ncbi:MAG: hypothetical protein ACK5UY_00760 [Holosporales bacterium]
MDGKTLARTIGVAATMLLPSCSGMMDIPEDCIAKVSNPALPKNAPYLEKQTKSQALIQQTTDGVVKVNIPKPDKTTAQRVFVKIGGEFVLNADTGQAKIFLLPVQAEIPLTDLTLPPSAFTANPETGTFPGISRSIVQIEAIDGNGDLFARSVAACIETKGR